MTTLRDLLNDFANDVINQIQLKDDTEVRSVEEIKEDLLDEYTEAIKERWVG